MQKKQIIKINLLSKTEGLLMEQQGNIAITIVVAGQEGILDDKDVEQYS